MFCDIWKFQRQRKELERNPIPHSIVLVNGHEQRCIKHVLLTVSAPGAWWQGRQTQATRTVTTAAKRVRDDPKRTTRAVCRCVGAEPSAAFLMLNCEWLGPTSLYRQCPQHQADAVNREKAYADQARGCPIFHCHILELKARLLRETGLAWLHFKKIKYVPPPRTRTAGIAQSRSTGMLHLLICPCKSRTPEPKGLFPRLNLRPLVQFGMSSFRLE